MFGRLKIFALPLLCGVALQPLAALADTGHAIAPAEDNIEWRAKPAAKVVAPVPSVSHVVAAPAKTEAPVKAAVKAAPLPSAISAPARQAVALQDALIEAYLHNPDLEAVRAELRGVDEQYAQAESGFRPSLTGSASYTAAWVHGDVTRNGSSRPKILALGVDLPIYSGGSTMAAVDQADNAIKAERAKLVATEQSVLLGAVTAYMNVIRDQDLVDLNVSNESVLKKHLEEASTRFRLGDLTKTDVSQSEAQAAAATAARVAAQGNLKISRADFERTIGLPADNLIKPATNITLPASMEEALGRGLSGNPVLIEAEYSRDAAIAATREIKGELLPSVALSGTIGRTYDPAAGADSLLDASAVTVQASIPLYEGGGTYSRVRQARQLETQLRHDVDSTVRSVRQSVTSAWETLSTANAEIESEKAGIAAAKLAKEGTEVEAKYGSRTTLEVLDAQQAYLNAQVAYVTSDRDRIVAAYTVLSAVGQLTAASLNLGMPVYDPLANFQTVKGKWAGMGIEGDKFQTSAAPSGHNVMTK